MSEPTTGNLFDEPPAPFPEAELEIPAEDRERIQGQRGRVLRLMSDGRWRTLHEIAQACSCSETGASARLRDLRKTAFGGHTVRRRLRFAAIHGLWEYAVGADRGDDHGRGTTDEDREATADDGDRTPPTHATGRGGPKGTHP